MSHRTYGETRDCKGCRYWSEMVAKVEGGEVLALCLARGGAARQGGLYTYARLTCPAWKSGHHGAVDDPPNYGEATRALYDAEEVSP